VLDAYPLEKFTGKVDTVPTYVDEESSTKTFKLKINIPNKDNKIVKGMTGDVNIVVAKESSDRVLPFDAIFSETGDKKFVWIVNKDNKLEKKYIEIGLEGDTLTSIKTELPEYVVIPDSTAKNVKEGNSVTF
jgi:HlyD family secretion protein